MPVFVRRDPPPSPCSDYRKYRPYVREDFRESCAYCLLHEILASGVDNFEVDHFRPKGDPRFKLLETDYYNLYYCCHVCNHYKAAVWPSVKLADEGYYFIDFCAGAFSEHFVEQANGEWSARSKAAQYTAKRLRLNRPHLREIRGLLREIATRRGLPTLNWDEPSGDQIKALLGVPILTT